MVFYKFGVKTGKKRSPSSPEIGISLIFWHVYAAPYVWSLASPVVYNLNGVISWWCVRRFNVARILETWKYTPDLHSRFIKKSGSKQRSTWHLLIPPKPKVSSVLCLPLRTLSLGHCDRNLIVFSQESATAWHFTFILLVPVLCHTCPGLSNELVGQRSYSPAIYEDTRYIKTYSGTRPIKFRTRWSRGMSTRVQPGTLLLGT